MDAFFYLFMKTHKPVTFKRSFILINVHFTLINLDSLFINLSFAPDKRTS